MTKVYIYTAYVAYLTILTIPGRSAQDRASECPDVKNYKWRLNPVWNRMLYSGTHVATVGVKGTKPRWHATAYIRHSFFPGAWAHAVIRVSARHSEKSAIPKAVIQGLRGIVLDIVSYYLAIGRFKGGQAGHPPRCQKSPFGLYFPYVA